ncbi:hypothetical protein JJB11_21425 [Ramlibacter ginsenosidimutans]|uniref:JAB domain-containing protein n=1 Tax=Ramlibacter ginsenosidimutans TaxID=502333 RepID=A0A934TWK5_9BURK|nr:hypothetical protein [Ramlibacter ginsenosidimutans]MBK6008670.1 hypothetical protein [Ramlibacter ginsenosidimutans]
MNKLRTWLEKPSPKLTCSERVWRKGVAELERRTLGARRESGAFLIGQRAGECASIEEFVFYDDLDPLALATGIVTFHGVNFPKLWEICKSKGLVVVADVHVHPRSYGQSPSDKSEPAIPRAGHIALILPDFARKKTSPGGIGQYEYLGNGCWADRTRAGVHFFRLE